MTTKIIKLKPWELLREVTENNKRWAYFVGTEKQLWEEPHDQSIDQLFYRLFGKYDVALVDDSIPEIKWNEFNWKFFNQYGGIPVSFGDLDQCIMHPPKKPRTLRESPIYFWQSDEERLPIPDNVEVKVILRNGEVLSERASNFDWTWCDGGADIIAFKLTGNVF